MGKMGELLAEGRRNQNPGEGAAGWFWRKKKKFNKVRDGCKVGKMGSRSLCRRLEKRNQNQRGGGSLVR